MLLVGCCSSVTARADAPDTAPAGSEFFALHGQFTYVEQEDDAFHAPYAGPNSLTPDQGRETTDLTLYVGLRPWPHAQFWVSPEIDQGFGFDDTLGLAGFSSAEAYKVGKNQPYLRLPRAYLRQTVDLGGDREAIAADQMQLSDTHSANYLAFTVGKFGVPDVFDTNQYAHDPRNDFLNWTAVDAGSFDYAADAWGFTVGAAAEWYAGSWTVRAGLFDLSNIPNSEHLDPGAHEFEMDAELEKRYELFGRDARVLVTVFDNRGRMALFEDAIALARERGGVPDLALVRGYRSRLGISLDLEQPLSDDLGVFARLGRAAGNVEAYEFTDVDRSLSGGVSIKGGGWHRPQDTLGSAAIMNAISGEREAYLNAGGLGILVGDGRLPHPGPELISETYYRLALLSRLQLSLDYQWIKNPAYNRDRGPVSIVALRVHAQFD